MSAIDNGGPAFPATEEHGLNISSFGMTLRDYFAAKADVSLYSPFNNLSRNLGRNPTVGEMAEYVANVRFAEADAMLAARQPKPQPDLLALLLRCSDAIEALDGTTVENERLVDDYRAAIAKHTGGA